jgi:hypothetical protein
VIQTHALAGAAIVVLVLSGPPKPTADCVVLGGERRCAIDADTARATIDRRECDTKLVLHHGFSHFVAIGSALWVDRRHGKPNANMRPYSTAVAADALSTADTAAKARRVTASAVRSLFSLIVVLLRYGQPMRYGRVVAMVSAGD